MSNSNRSLPSILATSPNWQNIFPNKYEYRSHSSRKQRALAADASAMLARTGHQGACYTVRILSFPERKKSLFAFFDLHGYIMIIFFMCLGIGLKFIPGTPVAYSAKVVLQLQMQE